MEVSGNAKVGYLVGLVFVVVQVPMVGIRSFEKDCFDLFHFADQYTGNMDWVEYRIGRSFVDLKWKSAEDFVLGCSMLMAVDFVVVMWRKCCEIGELDWSEEIAVSKAVEECWRSFDLKGRQWVVRLG